MKIINLQIQLIQLQFILFLNLIYKKSPYINTKEICEIEQQIGWKDEVITLGFLEILLEFFKK